MTESHGDNSCWINASLQALFAPLAFKDVLTQLWEAIPLDDRRAHQRAIDERQVRFGHEHPGPRLVNLPSLPAEGPPLERRLAMTFGCAHGGRAIEPMLPLFITEHYYRLHQEDAVELLTDHFLEVDSSQNIAYYDLERYGSI